MNAPDSNDAPGRLDLLRLFVNTLDLEADRPDALGSLESASAWCRANGLAPVSNARELGRLIEFREALRELLYANNREADEAASWEALRPFARTAQFVVTVDPLRGPVLEPGGAGAERTIATMLGIVHEAVANGTWKRLRACRRDSCKFAYYDHSKNGCRAWCSMATCGNREKAQRRRARDRAL
jgi:predicted RNA-binding Zn ribbon-like protein